MTDSKVIARLLEFAPPAIAAVAAVANRCILATRIGLGALLGGGGARADDAEAPVSTV